jgi:KaiC/GvpD/RAD55 family RecA-like ATPase
MDLKDTALKYLKNGKSIFPVGKNKKPLVKWDEYQRRLATIEEVENWWDTYPDANIGLVTGKISNLTVVDFDLGSEDYKKFPETLTIKTGSGGFHLYYQYYPMGNRAGILPHIDIRGDGGYVVAYPSETEDDYRGGQLYKRGGKYELIKEINFAKFPNEKFGHTENQTEKKHLKDLVGISIGSRNASMASVVGKLILTTHQDNWDKEIYPTVCAINQTYNPPLSEDELKSIYRSICSIEKKNKQSSSKNIAANPKNELHLWTPAEILTHDFGKEEWIVESLIPKQGITALSGNPGDFKTWITIHIALCISRGISVFGNFETTQGNVLIIDEEDNLRHLKKRLELLGTRDTDTIYYLSQNDIKVDVDEVLNQILEIIKEKKITFLILDSLVRIHQQEENDAGGMAKVFRSLLKIIGAGASILFTHHHRKQQGFGSNNPTQMMRGSSDILAAVDCHITLEKKRDEPDRLILKHMKSRQAEALEPFEISILKESLDDQGKLCAMGFMYAGGYDEKKKKAEEVSISIPLILENGMKSRSEIQEALREEFGKTAIDDGMRLAEIAGSIERVPKNELPKNDSRKVFYRLLKATNNIVEEGG